MKKTLTILFMLCCVFGVFAQKDITYWNKMANVWGTERNVY